MIEYEKRSFSKENFAEVGDLNGAEFYSCAFSGIEASQLSTAKGLRFIECRFEQCNLSNLNLTGFTFRDTHFEGCKLVGLNWSLCRSLVGPVFKDCKIDVFVPGATPARLSVFGLFSAGR